MAVGPVKLSRIYLKQQAAWGTKLTSFADADLLEVVGEFIPPANTEALQPDVNRPNYAEPPIYEGSQASFDVSFQFMLHRTSNSTPSGNPTARNEHQLFADVLGALEAGGYVTVGGGSTDTNLVTAGASYDLIGLGILVPISGGYRFVFPTDADPGTDMTVLDALAAAVAGQAHGSLTASAKTVFDSLPFTMQFAGAAANTGYRCWDGRVASLTINLAAKAQPTVDVTMRYLSWESVDALTAGNWAYPVSAMPAIKGVDSYDERGTFCFSSATITLSQDLNEVTCTGGDEGVSKLIGGNRRYEAVIRSIVDDAYANNWTLPGDTDAGHVCIQAGVTPGAAFAVLIPASMVARQETLQVINGLWGREIAYVGRVYDGDTDSGTTDATDSPFRVVFA